VGQWIRKGRKPSDIDQKAGKEIRAIIVWMAQKKKQKGQKELSSDPSRLLPTPEGDKNENYSKRRVY